MQDYRNMRFGMDVGAWCRKTGLKIDVIIRKILLDLLAEIVRRTPVDTGRCRANYFIGKEMRPPVMSDGMDKKGELNISVTRAMAKLKDVKGPGIYFIVNNLPYALPLEFGHSKRQAPCGMVRQAVAYYQDITIKACREVGMSGPMTK